MSTASAISAPAARRVALNAGVLVLLRLLAPMLSVGVVMAVSRQLGPADLGRYTLAFGVLQMGATLAPFGVSALLAREGARTPARIEALLGAALTLATLSSITLALLMAGLTLLLPLEPGTRLALLLLSPALLPVTAASVFEGAFVALERMEWIAVAMLCENVVKLAGAVAALLAGYGLPGVLIAAVAGSVAGALIAAARLRALGVRVRWGRDLETVRGLATLAPTFLLIALFATLYWRINLFMLAQMHGVAEVGAYGAAWRLLELSLILPQSLCLALYPQIAAARDDVTRLARLGNTALRLLLVAGLPIALGLTLLAPQVITLLYGDRFADAAPTLAVLIWTLIPYLWVRLHAYVLVAADRQRVDLTFNVLMTVLNVALNLVLIPAYGQLGAAVATLITMVVYAAGQYGYLWRALPGRAAALRIPAEALAGGVVAGAALWWLRDHGVAAAAAGVLLYGGALALGGFTTGGRDGSGFDVGKILRQLVSARG